MIVKQTVLTNLTLPEQLLDTVDIVVKDGKAKSRNELIASALRLELATLRQYEIYKTFEGKAADQQYRQEARRLSE